MDNRDKKTFAKDIKLYTKKEKVWSQIYKIELESLGHLVKLKDWGVDNSGNIIEKNLANHNADYLYIIDGEELPIEIKCIPEKSPFYTLKVNLLKSYIKQNASILIPRLYVYYIVHPKAMQIFLDTNHHNIYKTFSPNDLCIRFYDSQMQKYVKEGLVLKGMWGGLAKEEIQKNKKLLFRSGHSKKK
jgi:hypothetical protein